MCKEARSRGFRSGLLGVCLGFWCGWTPLAPAQGVDLRSPYPVQPSPRATPLEEPLPPLGGDVPPNASGPAARVAELPADREKRPDASPTSSGLRITRPQPTSVKNPSMTGETPPAAASAEKVGTATSTETVLNGEELARRIAQVQAATDLDEPSKAELVKRLQKVQEQLTQADDLAKKATQFSQDVKQSPQLITEAAERLAVPAAEAASGPAPDDELPKIEQHLTQVEAQLSATREELTKRDAELKRRNERKAELAKLIADSEKKLEELRPQRAAPGSADEKPSAKLVRQTELEAREIFFSRQLEAARAEVQRMDAFAKLAPLQRDLAKRQVTLLEKEQSLWQKALAERRKAESIRQAEEARRQLENAHPALRQLATRNSELADKRRVIAASIERVTDESRALSGKLSEVTADYKRLQERIHVAKMSRANGMLLRKQRAELNFSIPRERLRFVEFEMPAIQVALIEFEEERASLGDVEALVLEVDSKLPLNISPSERQLVQRTAANLFAMKRELLDKVIYDHNGYLDELSELELSSRRLLDESEALRAFIDQNVLWIRSAEPLDQRDLRRAAQATGQLLNAELWFVLGTRVFHGLWLRPVPSGIVLVLVLVLMFMRRRMTNRLRSLCGEDTGNNALHFLPTLEALGLVLLSSSVWPCLMWCIGWWLGSAYDQDSLTTAVAAGLQRGALFLLLFQLVRNSTSAGGIGETHFGWYVSGTRVVRENLLWLAGVGIPIAVAVTVVGEVEDGQWNDSLGRLAFMAGMVVTATAMHQIFRRQKGMFHEALARSPQSWLNRIRLGGHLTGTGVPCALAVLAAAGYYYSARQLAIRLELTMLIALGLGLTHGVVSRWFLVKRRNLAIKQARERRSAQEDAGEHKPVVPAPTNLSAIQSQLQVLLRYGVVLAVLVVVSYVWADVLPAIHILDRFVLWSSPDSSTTLTNVLLAIIFAIGTAVMGQNLPALLEITILDRLPIDHGGRHAVSIIFRYLVYVSGVLLVARTVNISWSSVQWLAAAMTVGLGFGLQEIFGNLISGLIILFERPIRVGDLVTVNGVTGTVTRMQIRATTITDADRRELIVPNKKFITEDVINWSLTDSISRITIEVGVAYGTDANLVHTLLMKVATAHPLVMTDPAPVAIFKKFGESTLDFSLYVFIASREAFRVVLHDLHLALEKEFREAKIEIAYPQRDVHIVSVSNAALPGLEKIQSAKAA